MAVARTSLALVRYLEELDAAQDRVTLTFTELEALLGIALGLRHHLTP